MMFCELSLVATNSGGVIAGEERRWLEIARSTYFPNQRWKQRRRPGYEEGARLFFPLLRSGSEVVEMGSSDVLVKIRQLKGTL
jgi:hypothetical protein